MGKWNKRKLGGQSDMRRKSCSAPPNNSFSMTGGVPWERTGVGEKGDIEKDKEQAAEDSEVWLLADLLSPIDKEKSKKKKN